MSSENVYLIAAADHLAGAIAHSVRHDKPRTLSQLKQGIERGIRLFESWMEDHGGRVLLFQGDRIFAELPGENLESLPDLHAQVQDAWGDTITVGVGLDLTEADKACHNGRQRGGKRIVFYAPEVEQHLDNETSASESHDATAPESDPEELKSMSLNKANTPSPGPPTPNAQPQPSFSQGGAPSPHSAPSPFAAGQGQPSGADMPPPPSSTNAAAGLSPVEAQMREMASQGEAQGARAEGQANAADDGTTGPDQLKQGISRILMKVKEQAQVLEQLKEQAPEAYKAILGMVQIVATIGKQLMPPKGEGQDQGQEEGAPIAKAYIVESDDDVRQLRRSYEVGGPETAPLKSTGINQQVNVQDHVYNKEELAPSKPLPPVGRLDKIRKAAMMKWEWKPTHCETKDCPNPAEENSHQCKECNTKYPWPSRPPGDPDEEVGLDKALPMPEAGAHQPPKASGSLLSRLRGDASPQAHKYFHQTPGEAAHVGMDGKPAGKNVVRQYQSGMVKPINNRAETDTGNSHPVSALNPTDSEGRGGQ